MPENKTVSGVISQINRWKKGSGFFLVLENDDTDYFKYGNPSNEAGESVEMEVKPGTDRFADKFEIVAIGKGAPQRIKEGLEKIKVPPSPAAEIRTPLISDAMKQRLIVEQCCLKAAARVVGELMARDNKMLWEDVGKIVNDLKAQFLEDIMPKPEAKK